MTFTAGLKAAVRGIVFLPLRPLLLLPAVALLRRARVLPHQARKCTQAPRRILVINLTSFLGDTVMMLPMLDRLRQLCPEAHIEVVTTPAMAPLLRSLSHLSAIHAFPAPPTGLPGLSTYRQLWRMANFARTHLAEVPIDLCLLPRWGTDPHLSPHLAVMTGAATLYGHHPADDSEGHSSLPTLEESYTGVSRGGHGLPEAVRELRLLTTAGLMPPLQRAALAAEELQPIQALVSIAQAINLPELQGKLGLDPSSSYAVLAPGASHPARRWPYERFAAVARHLHATRGLQSVLLGAPGDVALGASIAREAPESVQNLIGFTALPETVALLAGASLLLANDSGPAHLGAGLGTPTLVLSACPATSTREHASSPRRVRPVGPRVQVLQPERATGSCRERCTAGEERCTAGEAHCILALSTLSVQAHLLQLL